MESEKREEGSKLGKVEELKKKDSRTGKKKETGGIDTRIQRGRHPQRCVCVFHVRVCLHSWSFSVVLLAVCGI